MDVTQDQASYNKKTLNGYWHAYLNDGHIMGWLLSNKEGDLMAQYEPQNPGTSITPYKGYKIIHQFGDFYRAHGELPKKITLKDFTAQLEIDQYLSAQKQIPAKNNITDTQIIERVQEHKTMNVTQDQASYNKKALNEYWHAYLNDGHRMGWLQSNKEGDLVADFEPLNSITSIIPYKGYKIIHQFGDPHRAHGELPQKITLKDFTSRLKVEQYLTPQKQIPMNNTVTVSQLIETHDNIPQHIQQQILASYNENYKTIKGKPFFTSDFNSPDDKTLLMELFLEELDKQPENGTLLHKYLFNSIYKAFDFSTELESFISNSSTQTYANFINKHPETKDVTEETCRRVIESTMIHNPMQLLQNIEIPLVITLDPSKLLDKNPALQSKLESRDTKDEGYDDLLTSYYLLDKQGIDIAKTSLLSTEKISDDFVKSIQDEYFNRSSNFNSFAFLVSLSPSEIEKILDAKSAQSPKEGYLSIPANAVCGFYDPYNGGGSLMNVNLKKEFSLPLSHIDTIGRDGHRGYSIKEIYQNNYPYEKATLIDTPLPEKKITPPLSNVELFIKQFNDKFARDMESGKSVILQPRSGADYSINSDSGKRFSGTSQLVLQQVRADNEYDSTNFARFTDEQATQIKPNSSLHFINEYNSTDKTHTQTMYVNHDSLKNNPTDIPPYPLDLPKNTAKYDPKEYLYNDIYNYMYSIYRGDNYQPSELTVKNKQSLAREIREGKISPIKYCEKAETRVIDALKQNQEIKNTQKENHKRGRK